MLETQEKRIYLDHFIHGRNIKALTCSARRPYPPQILLKSTKTWFYYMRYITDICFVFIHWEVILRFPALLPETPQPPFEAWQSRAGWRRRAGEGSPAPSDSTRRTESARAKGWCWSTVHPSGLRSRRAELYSPLSTTRHPQPPQKPTCCSPKSLLVNSSGLRSSSSTAPFSELASNNCGGKNLTNQHTSA